MAIQSKVWGLVDAEGKFIEALGTRKLARAAKSEYKRWSEWFPDVVLPIQMVQYKRWKKVS